MLSRPKFRIGLRLFYLLCIAASLLLAFVGIRFNTPRDATSHVDDFIAQSLSVDGDIVHAKFTEGLGDFYRPLSNVDLLRLRSMTQLESLDIHGSQITDDGLAPVLELKRLKHVKLVAPKVTGAILNDIAELKELRTLDIGQTGIEPRDIDALTSLPKLTGLIVPERFDDRSMAKLQEKLPNCSIRRRWKDLKSDFDTNNDGYRGE